MLVCNDDDQVGGTDLPQAVRAARPCEDCRPGANDGPCAVQGDLASAAHDVVDLVLLLAVVSDRGARVKRAFTKHQLQVRSLREEGVRGRLAAAVVRARLLRCDGGVALDKRAPLQWRNWSGATAAELWEQEAEADRSRDRDTQHRSSLGLTAPSFRRLLGSADLDDPNEHSGAVVAGNRVEQLTCHSEPGAVGRSKLRPE